MYVDWADLVNRYQDVAKIVGASDANSYVLADAEAHVNGRLAAKYTVPFTPCPQVVKTLCVDYAYWRLAWRQKGMEQLREDIESRLDQILAGTLLLVTASGTAVAAGGDTAWTDTPYHTSFGPDGETAWVVDSRWLDDVQDSRL